MKKIFFAIIAIIFMAVLVSCGSFSGVKEKDWKLIEVRINDDTINFDRKNLVDDGFGEIFTLKFDARNVSGAGAPNRYTAPYKLEKGKAVSVQAVRTTLMASIFEPERVRESEFFVYIENIYEWDIDKDKNLILTSKNANEDKVTLVFSL